MVGERSAVDHVLEQSGQPPIVGNGVDLPGGCIHRVRRFALEDGRAVVAKLGAPATLAIFEEERAGLEALAATGTVLVPRSIGAGVHDGVSVLVMTALEAGPADEGAWRRFGGELATLHAAPMDARYGFEHDNHLGSTPQPNPFETDWVVFNARWRLGHQVNLASAHGSLRQRESVRVRRLIDRLDTLLPRRPRPSLLHGDLWSGNGLPSVDEDGRPRIGIIDPACSIGDGWADIAMMKLFGGFPDSCLSAYEQEQDDRERVPERIAVYQLYHVLNHVNIFGRGYVAQAMSLVDRLLGPR